ncbi:uncharacterized protein LOC126786616 isoform X2 [Argentina anserina]|uniref:uncharacterized protein LOC126786616 isoform X2 n=1 Tax=Argentina anserina TaxID=57926 RepID=UPI00217641AE|nr:uncharacterized protein LOC126786616 isoform X2 [Potentilla anserina]
MSSERKHTSEQKMQKSRRSGEDKIKVTLRRHEVEAVGSPSQVGRFFQAACGVQRSATSSSGESRPRLPPKSQEHGTSLVRSDREHRSSQQTGSRRIQTRTSEAVVSTC